jgi:hypothetical protein
VRWDENNSKEKLAPKYLLLRVARGTLTRKSPLWFLMVSILGLWLFEMNCMPMILIVSEARAVFERPVHDREALQQNADTRLLYRPKQDSYPRLGQFLVSDLRVLGVHLRVGFCGVRHGLRVPSEACGPLSG